MCWILERVRMWKVKEEREGNVITTTGEIKRRLNPYILKP